MMKVEPQQEHRWLEGLVGEWECEMEAAMVPGEAETKHKSTESVRSLGGVWVLCEGRSETPDGGVATTQMTLGYDPVRKRYVGTFIGSMMTHLWVYDGERDGGGNVLTLDAEGPNFAVEGKMAKYKDVIEIKDEDTRTLSSSYLGDDGRWHHFMTATYRRVK